MAIKSYLIAGKAKWAKIIGEPRPGFDETSKEWSFDLYLDETGVKDFLASGADKFYLKEDKETGESFVRFVRKATKQDGSDGKPIRVVDQHGDDWGTRLIGNGSELNVRYSLNEVKSKGTKKLKPSVLAVQVWGLQDYRPKENFPTKPKESTTLVQAEAETW